MSDKEIAAKLTKAYIQAYVSGILADQKLSPSAKTDAIRADMFASAYKKFYDIVSSTPAEK